MRAINWRQSRRTSFRAFVLRQVLKINFRYWKDKTSIDATAIRKREKSLSRFAPRIPRKIKQEHCKAGAADLYFLRASNTNEQRLILYMNGGGYVAGSPMGTHRDFIWRIGEACNAVIAALDYRKAPDNPYPAALDDASAAYSLLQEKFESGSVVFMGDSAGGGLALALVHKLRNKGFAVPASVVAFSPWTDLANTGASVKENMQTERMVPARMLDQIAAKYLAGEDAKNPYISPLYGDFCGFPPTLIFASDTEALRDDALRVAAKLRESSAPVNMQLWHNLPHIWPIFARTVPESRAAIQLTAMFLETHWAASSSGN